MNFGPTLKKALKCQDLPTDFATWSAIARDRPRWRLLAHSAPTPALRCSTLRRLALRLPTLRRQALLRSTSLLPTQPPSTQLREPFPCLLVRSPDLVRALRPSAIRRNARRRPRRPASCPRQPRQRSTSAAPSCARHRAWQLKKKTTKTLPTISGCFVLGCQSVAARIYFDGQYF
jgi:hypothetical protein